MDIFLVLKIISFLASAGTIYFAVRVLPGAKLKILFTASIAFFFLSTVLYFEEGVVGEWEKHAPFFIGQLFLYFFLTALVKEKISTGNKFAGLVVPFSVSDTTRDFFIYSTEQGVQHIIVLPLALIVATTISARLIGAEKPAMKPAMRYFFLALFSLVMIHVSEFLIESQGLLPFLDGMGIEMMEFLFFYLALFALSAGLKEISRARGYINERIHSFQLH